MWGCGREGQETIEKLIKRERERNRWTSKCDLKSVTIWVGKEGESNMHTLGRGGGGWRRTVLSSSD